MKRSTSGWMKVGGLLGLAVLMAGLVVGCTSTKQMRKTETSGFLTNYSQLKKGQKDEALMVYVNPKADFKKYTKVMLDPVRIYAMPDSELAELPKDDLQNLVNYLDATLREHLKKDYTIVTQSGPDVMRLRVAITEAEGANVVMDTISTLLPIGLAISAVKNVAVGSHTSVGRVGVECEALGADNTRLFAAVDARVGNKFTGKFDKFEKWRTSTDAFDFWAERLQARLKEERNKGGQ